MLDRLFDKLKICKICDKEYSCFNGLSVHLKTKHNLEAHDYILKYELNNVWPLCKCGCNEKVNFYQNRFHDYITGHYTKTKEFPNPWRIKGRTPKNKKYFADEEVGLMKKMLIEDHLNIYKIGIHFNCSKNPITRILDKEIGKANRIEVCRKNDSWRRINDPILNAKIRIAAAKGGAAYSKFNDTKPEKLMKSYLQELGIRNKFKFQFFLKDYQTNQTYCYDFGDIDQKVLIECDGNYWHGNPKIYKKLNETQQFNKLRDLEKNKVAQRNGFKLLRFWENNIYNEPEKVKQQIIQTYKGLNNVSL
jgi:very-short-patch-repair endonuclease